MIKYILRYNYCIIALLFCILQVAGIDAFGQEAIALQDSTITRDAPKARARRNREAREMLKDSTQIQKMALLSDSTLNMALDSVLVSTEKAISIADSIDLQNQKAIEDMQTAYVPPQPRDTVAPPVPREVWIPNPTKATWLAVVFPGGGQIYNRKFWKLPIIYGGFAGCAYALTWNGKMYKDYSQAYLDIMDDDPNTNSYLDLLPNRSSSYSEAQLAELIRKRKDTFRRYRDLSIFAVIGVYLISIIDAYVDAELSNFDITPDLSMRVEPVIMNDQFRSNNKSVGVQCSFRF